MHKNILNWRELVCSLASWAGFVLAPDRQHRLSCRLLAAAADGDDDAITDGDDDDHHNEGSRLPAAYSIRWSWRWLRQWSSHHSDNCTLPAATSFLPPSCLLDSHRQPPSLPCFFLCPQYSAYLHKMHWNFALSTSIRIAKWYCPLKAAPSEILHHSLFLPLILNIF